MGINNKTRQKLILTVVLLPLLITLSIKVFGQSTRGSVSGTVSDTSKGVLPGAAVTIKNVDTGITSTAKTNSVGNYSVAGLQPGIYTLTVELSGFQIVTKTDVQLSANGQVRLNIELPIKGANTEVQVTSSALGAILDASSSTGTVMGPETATALPLVGNNMMELVNIMGGVTADGRFRIRQLHPDFCRGSLHER